MSSEVAISNHPRRTALAALLRTLSFAAADERRMRLADGLEELLQEHGLDDAAAHAGDVDVVALLRRCESERPTFTAPERAALRRLLAHGVADGVRDEAIAGDMAALDELAQRLGWLAANTALDVLPELDGVLGAADVDPLWQALFRRVGTLDAQGTADARAEALLILTALGTSPSPKAEAAVRVLAAELVDPVLRKLADRLASDAEVPAPEPPASVESEDGEGAADGDVGDLEAPRPRRSLHARRVQISGQRGPRPFGEFGVVLGALSGFLALRFVARVVATWLLRCERPVDLRVDGTGITLNSRVSLFGRLIREGEVAIPFANLASATREIEYPRMGLYAGLVALALGTFLGVSLVSDGVWSRSPSLVALGAGVFGVGLALDLLLSGLGVGRGGAYSLVFVPRRGAPFCVAVDDVHAADEVLRAIADRST